MVAGDSSSKRNTSGTAVCMRKASSYDLMRARSAGSSGYFTAESRFEPPQQLELVRPALRGRPRVPGAANGSGFLRIDRELNAVVLRAQITRTVAAEPAAAIGDRRAHDHELRQIVVQRAQPIVNPRADRGKLPFKDVPAGVKLQLGAVVVVGRPHRADDREVVDASADVRPPVADLDAGLTSLAIADLQRIERLADVAVGVVRARRSARCP